MSPDDTPALLEALGGCLAQGRLDGCEVEYWTGGGLPPPYYRSDQFRLHAIEGREVVELARPRYDVPAPGDAYPVERFIMDARPEHVRAVVQMILAGNVFTERHPEEDAARAPDALSTEVIVTVEGVAFERRYGRRVPEAVEPLRVEVERLTRDVIERGAHGIYLAGRLLELVRPALP